MSADLYTLDAPARGELLAGWGAPRFRARQLTGWLYDSDAADFEAMTNLPATLRARLTEGFRLGARAVTEQRSSDGTRKRLSALEDGKLVESVLMPYARGRRTACISTQAGCAMGCVFCATGQMGFARHLGAGEIFSQAAHFARELRAEGERLSNVVLMGMGEPFHNYDASVAAIRRIMDELGIGARHITVSTVGLVPEIRRFAEEGLQVRLAVSLHAATDEARAALLPINRRWPLAELMAACRTYADRTGRRITFEWALIDDGNDSTEAARRLVELVRGLPCHVNIIPLNPTGGFAGRPSGAGAVDRFVAIVEAAGIPATVRVRRGLDIDAGCGQLRERERDQRSV